MVQALVTVEDLKVWLFKAQYSNLIQYMGNEEKARKFLSAVVSCFQTVPELAKCTPESLMSSFMKIAEFDMFPSNVSGQAYVLPYKNFNKGTTEAQFQLGYKWLVTLFYRYGTKAIRAEIVRQCDEFSYENGVVRHSADVFNPERHKSPAIGAYVIIDLPNGGIISKAMGKTEILGIRDRFSKSKDTASSPWNEKNDPELWQWKKTVIKQVAKLVPTNERLIQAINYDNEGETDFEEIARNDLKSKALRPSEWNVLDLISSPIEQWEQSEILKSVTMPNEPNLGTKVVQEELQAQDSQVSWVLENQPEKS